MLEKDLMMKINDKGALSERPQAVIFDTDNTLYAYEQPHQVATAAVLKKATSLFGVGEEEFSRAVDEARSAVKRRLGHTASSHSRLLYFQRAIEIIGLKTQLLATLDLEQTYWRTFLNESRLFPEVRDFILDIKAMGIKVANITDLTAQIQFRKLIYFGLDDVFDFVVTSEEAGLDKPAEQPFIAALEKLNVSAESCWMIGDNWRADIVGGKAMGMVTCLKKHEGVQMPPKDVEPSIVFGDYRHIRELFRGNFG